MALLEESLSVADAAKRLRVDVSRIRQRLREWLMSGRPVDAVVTLARDFSRA